jgi:membrane associated rhomboid family serine protease
MPEPDSSAREPIFTLPAIIVFTVGVLLGVHVLRELILSPETDFHMLLELAVVPARWAVAYGGASVESILTGIAGPAGDMAEPRVQLARYILSEPGGKPWTALTYALLHGSWTHVLMNSVWLAAFGTPVARRCGTGRFLVIAAVAAGAGASFYALLNADQPVPLIGASGAVSGMMGAASWFMFAQPTWMLEGRLTEPHERPRERIGGIFANRQVVLFLVVWFAINYFSAVFAQPLGVTDTSIAWEAHVGGFLAGFFLFPVFDPIPARSR